MTITRLAETFGYFEIPETFYTILILYPIDSVCSFGSKTQLPDSLYSVYLQVGTSLSIFSFVIHSHTLLFAIVECVFAHSLY